MSEDRPDLLIDEDEALSRFSDAELERFARHLVLPEIGARGQLRLSRSMRSGLERFRASLSNPA